MSILRRLAPYFAYLYVSVVGLTSRLRWLGSEHLDAARRLRGPVIYAFWHQRQVFFTWTHRRSHAKVLVSRSADGEIIAQTMRLSGIGACRGSSSRGAAAAARELLAAAREAMLKIAEEAANDPDLVKGAPYTTPVRRLDEAGAARNPDLRWTPAGE